MSIEWALQKHYWKHDCAFRIKWSVCFGDIDSIAVLCKICKQIFRCLFEVVFVVSLYSWCPTSGMVASCCVNPALYKIYGKYTHKYGSSIELLFSLRFQRIFIWKIHRYSIMHIPISFITFVIFFFFRRHQYENRKWFALYICHVLQIDLNPTQRWFPCKDEYKTKKKLVVQRNSYRARIYICKWYTCIRFIICRIDKRTPIKGWLSFTCVAAFCRFNNGSDERFRNRRSLFCGGGSFFRWGDGCEQSSLWKTRDRDARTAYSTISHVNRMGNGIRSWVSWVWN